MIVEVHVTGDRVAFTIPASYPVYGGGAFEGRFDARGITGRFIWKPGAVEHVLLKRGRGYWDR